MCLVRVLLLSMFVDFLKVLALDLSHFRGWIKYIDSRKIMRRNRNVKLFALAVASFSFAQLHAKFCGGFGSGNNTCACGDTVIGDTNLTFADPVIVSLLSLSCTALVFFIYLSLKRKPQFGCF